MNNVAKFTPLELAQAHQFIYYCFPDYVIWSDYDYDRYCLYHGIDGSGGSDNPMDYSPAVKDLAWKIRANRSLYQGVFDEIPNNISDIKTYLEKRGATITT